MPARKPRPQSSSAAASRKSRACVLHLCADLGHGDPARETVDLAILSQRTNWRTLVASNGGALVTEAERAAVRHIRMPLHKTGPFTGWRNHVQLEALTRRERPSLIHAHGIETLRPAWALSRHHRLPLVIDFTQPLPDRPRLRRMLKRLGGASCAVRAPSEYIEKQLIDVFHLPRARIHLIPPGIDTQWYNATSISAERLQKLSQLWRLPEHASIVLVPLPLGPGMGHEVLLRALGQVQSDNIFTVVVGDDRRAPGTRAVMENLAAQHGLQGKIIMPESCADWPAAYWLASVIVAANIAPRGQHRGLLAAQAIGRPVIATDSGANAEMVRGGETAWLIPPDDAQALTDALCEATALETDQRLALARETRQFVKDNFPQAEWFNGITRLYESLLASSSRRG